LIGLAGRRGRLVAFVKLGLEADRTLLDPGGDRQAGYPSGVLVRVADMVRMRVYYTLVTSVAGSTVGSGSGSIAGEIYGQVLGGGDQGCSVGTTTGSVA
jgi:hypothetical protein